MKKIQAAIFDVDGTLFDYQHHKIHDSTVQAIRSLKKAGVLIIIASGRSYPLLGEECLSKIPADYYVMANGHCIQDGKGREIFSNRFTYDQTEYIVNLTRKHGNGLLLKYEDYSYLYSRPDEMYEVFDNIGLSADTFVDCRDMNYHQQKLPIGFTIRNVDRIYNELASHSSTYRIELFHDVTECDIFSPRINKMTALKKLFSLLNLNPEDCIAFGDSRNDIEMIRWAGCGIAMGNACDDLKKVADTVCAASWADGIAQTIYRFQSNPAYALGA